jgi:hypothetical protein
MWSIVHKMDQPAKNNIKSYIILLN